MAGSVAGLAKLSGYSRMHVNRLVRAGVVTLNTPEALRWSWHAAKRNYQPDTPPLNLRRNHPARREALSMLQELLPIKRASGRSVDLRLVQLMARAIGEPNPEKVQLTDMVGKLAAVSSDAAKTPSVMRQRKQVPLVDFMAALNTLQEQHQTQNLRSIGRVLGVSAASVSRWFSLGGHLFKHRQVLASACNGAVAGSGQRRNGRPFIVAA